MWFKKNVVIEELQKMDKFLDNRTVKNAMLRLISDYCRVHIVDYKDASKLESLGIKKQFFFAITGKGEKKKSKDTSLVCYLKTDFVYRTYRLNKESNNQDIKTMLT